MNVNAIAAATQNTAQSAAADGGAGSGTDFVALLHKYAAGYAGMGGLALGGNALMSMVDAAEQADQAAQGPVQAAPILPQTAKQIALPMQSDTPRPDNQSDTIADDGSQGSDRGSSGQRQEQASATVQSAASAPSDTTNDKASTGNTPAAPTANSDDAQTEAAAAVIAVVYAPQAVPTATATGEGAEAAPVAANGGNSPPLPALPNFVPTGDDEAEQTPAAASPALQTAIDNAVAAPIIAAAKAVSAANAAATASSASAASTASAASPLAQQAADLAQTIGQTNVSVSVSSQSSGGGVSAQNTASLAPEAVLALPGIQDDGANGQSGAGSDDDSQTTDQQTASGQQLASLTDADAANGWAQDAQALFNLTNVVASLSQDSGVASTTQAAGVTAVAATADAPASAAQPMPLAQPPAQQQNGTAQTSETASPQAAQAKAPTTAAATIEQIKVEILKGLQQGSGTIRVQVNPADLGRVEIKLDVQNGQARATITADRPETLQMLKNDAAGLQQALSDAGLSTNASSLSFFLRGDQQPRQFAQGGRQSRTGSGRSGAANGAMAISGLSGATADYQSSSAASALDISV